MELVIQEKSLIRSLEAVLSQALFLSQRLQASINEDVTTDVTLSYRDHDNDLATGCDVTTDRVGELILGSCSCLAGVCSVEMNSAANWNGLSQFSYRITDNDGVSPYQPAG